MNFFKKRRNAVAVFVVVVILFSLIGAHRSIRGICRQAEDAFFDKSLLHQDGYYTCPADQLKNCLALTNRLLSVIGSDGQWEAAYTDLYNNRLALDKALAGRDIPDIFITNVSLIDAVAQVEAVKTAGAPLPDSYDDFDAIVSDFYSAEAEAADPAYNAHIQNFIADTLSAFPTNILRRLTFVPLPDSYR